MRELITIFVAGKPIGQPRAKAYNRGGRAGVYDPGTANEWKAKVAAAATHWHNEKLDGPLRVRLCFSFPRPKHHYGTGKNRLVLKPAAPEWHTSKPDCDNLEKAVLDVLTDVQVWLDDSQVCDLKTSKRYNADRPGCDIEISEP